MRLFLFLGMISRKSSDLSTARSSTFLGRGDRGEGKTASDVIRTVGGFTSITGNMLSKSLVLVKIFNGGGMGSIGSTAPS